MRVHVVAAAHRRLDAAAAGRAFRRGDDGAVVLGHRAGHQVGTAAAAGQAADRHAAIMAVVGCHAGATTGWGLGVSRAMDYSPRLEGICSSAGNFACHLSIAAFASRTISSSRSGGGNDSFELLNGM